MQGLWFAPDAPPRLRGDLPRPTARDGWTRVRVLQVGLCATDLALQRGYMGFQGVPGHEFVGVAIDGPCQGQRVVGEINAACGNCTDCASANDRHCRHRGVLGILGLPGACAEELSLPQRNLHLVPTSVGNDAATFTEPLAAALHLGDDIDLAVHRRALVAGDGKLGLLCAWALHLSGCDVTVAGRHPERQALLPPRAQHVTGWLEGDATPTVAPFDLAVEASGSPAVLQRLLPLVRPRGTVALKTTSERSEPLDLSLAVVNELRLVGSRCGPFSPALAVLAQARVPVEALVSARYPMSEAPAALQHASRRGMLKVVLDVATP